MEKLSSKEQKELLSMFVKTDFDSSLLAAQMGIKYLELYPEDLGFKAKLFNKIKDNIWAFKIIATLGIKYKKRWR